MQPPDLNDQRVLKNLSLQRKNGETSTKTPEAIIGLINSPSQLEGRRKE
jgi:hypothetical protein